MSLEQTIRYANQKLDRAEALLELHSEELTEHLAENEPYTGNYEEELLRQVRDTGTAVRNAENQFLRYEETYAEIKLGEEPLGTAEEQHGTPATTDQHNHLYREAHKAVNRHETLQQQFKALSQIMEQNGLTDLQHEMKQQNPWYEEPEDAEGFRKASNIH